MASNNSNISNTNQSLPFGSSNMKSKTPINLFGNNTNSLPPQLNVSNINLQTNPFQSQLQQTPPLQQTYLPPTNPYPQPPQTIFSSYSNVSPQLIYPPQQPIYHPPQQNFASIFGLPQNPRNPNVLNESYADD